VVEHGVAERREAEDPAVFVPHPDFLLLDDGAEEDLILFGRVQSGQKRQLVKGTAEQSCDRRRVFGCRTPNHAFDPRKVV
jgi:hypothetical protein